MQMYIAVFASLALGLLLAVPLYKAARQIRCEGSKCQQPGGAVPLPEIITPQPGGDPIPTITPQPGGIIPQLAGAGAPPDAPQVAALKQQVATLQAEKDLLEAKYLQKVKAAGEKKRNLAQYRQGKRDARKRKPIPDQVAEILKHGAEWLPHSCAGAKSHKMGKPPGSHGATWARPHVTHNEVELHPRACDRCGAGLSGQQAYFAWDSVVTELFHATDEKGFFKYRQLKNILKKVYRKKCPQCGKWVYPPQGLFANAHFGVALVCFVISERIQTRLPYAQLIRSMARDFGGEFALSEAAIIAWFLKFEAQLEAMYCQLEALLKAEAFAHLDETGAPVNGENWWLWVLCTANVVLFKLSESRGHESVADILEDYDGTIISDFFRAYDTFKGHEHQKCLSHLLGAIIEAVVRCDKENGRIGKALGQHEKAARAEAEAQAGNPVAPKKRGRKAKVEKLGEEEVAALRQRKEANAKAIHQGTRLRAFFKQPFDEKSPLGWHNAGPNRLSAAAAQEQAAALVGEIRAEGVENEEVRKILDRCEKYMDSLFTYLDHAGMPPDNNEAERALRPFAVQRRVSGGFKSPPLLRHYAVYLSLYMTCKANSKDFEALLPRVLSQEGADLRRFLFT